MIRIPVLDLSKEINELKPLFLEAFERVLDSGAFIMGPNVKEFEKEVAGYLGVKHAVALNSGTDALVIGLLAAGIGPGDEVITTPFTFFATAEAISQVGATPVFADVEENTYNINPARLEATITPRTKAIIPVHLFGLPVNMGPIMDIARKRRLIVIEDTAQAFGAECEGRKAGTIGDIGCYSFFPSKNLGAFGDGGLLTTDNDGFALKATMLRVHGSQRKYFNETVGFNSRLDELQAALLRIKLPFIDRWNEGRKQAANRYRELLAGVEGIKLADVTNVDHVYHQFTIRILNGRRDEVLERLERDGVQTMVYYPTPVHRLPVYQDIQAFVPVAELLAQEVLSLPIWPQIEPSVQSFIVQRLKAAL